MGAFQNPLREVLEACAVAHTHFQEEGEIRSRWTDGHAGSYLDLLRSTRRPIQQGFNSSEPPTGIEDNHEHYHCEGWNVDLL